MDLKNKIMKETVAILINIRLKIMVLLVMLTFINGCSSSNELNDEHAVRYLDDVYSMIKGEEFFVGNIIDDQVLLKNSEFKVIKEIPFQSSEKKTNQIYFKRE